MHENPQQPPQDSPKKGRDIANTWMYKTFIKSAYALIDKPLAILTVLKKSVARLQRYENLREFAADAREQLSTLIRLVRCYIRGEYREVSVRNVALSIAALLYFLSPFDLIPDFLAVGFIDDLALLSWVYTNFKGEFEAFLEWEDNKKTRIEIGTIANEEDIKG